MTMFVRRCLSASTLPMLGALYIVCGLAGCGNSGEGQIKIDPSVRKNLSDEGAPKGQTPATFKAKGADGDMKGRLKGSGND